MCVGVCVCVCGGGGNNNYIRQIKSIMLYNCMERSQKHMLILTGIQYNKIQLVQYNTANTVQYSTCSNPPHSVW